MSRTIRQVPDRVAVVQELRRSSAASPHRNRRRAGRGSRNDRRRAAVRASANGS